MKTTRTFFWSAMILCVGLIQSSLAQYAGVGTFSKITSIGELEEGYYVVANVEDEFAMNNVNAGSFFEETAISPSDDSLQNPSVSIVWWFEEDGAGWTVYNEDSERYVAYTGGDNAAQAVETVTDEARWTFTYDDEFIMQNVDDTDRVLRYNTGSPRFVAYSTTFGQNLSLFQLEVSETNELNMLVPGGVVTQGMTVASSVVITEALEDDLVVTLSSSDPAVADVSPSSVTILEGETSATFDLTAAPIAEPGADIPITLTANADGFDEATLGVTVINDNAPFIELTAAGYEQDFADFVSAETLPIGWSVAGPTTTYNGDWGGGTAAGMRGNDNVLGYQHTAAADTFEKIVTFRNDTGDTITNLTVSYLGRVERVAQTRLPAYEVSVDGVVVPDLAYSTADGVDKTVLAGVSGLSIATGETFEIVWASEHPDGSGSSRQIGIGEVEVTFDAPVDQPPILSFDPPGTEKSVFTGNPISFDVIATQVPEDAGQTTEISALQIPAGATFPGATGAAPVQATFDWTPMDAGMYTSVFVAADVDGAVTQAVTIAVLGPQAAPAGTLVLYDFDGEVNFPSLIADNLDWTLFEPNDERNISYFTGVPGDAISATGWNEEDRYYEFALEVAEGFAIAVTNMSFDERATSTGATNWFLRSSLDGFTSDLAGGPVENDGNWDDWDFPLSIAGATGTVTFRMYAQSEGTGPWRIDNVLLGGEVTAAGLIVSVDKADGFVVEEGTSEVITASAVGGEEPYAFDWATDLDAAHYDADDDTFTILATAPAGDYFATVTVTDDAAEEDDTTVTFSVAPKYDITITPPVNGMVETDPADNAFEGETVTITATPDGGYVVDDVEVVGDDTTSITVTDDTFTMPDQNVTVTVTFAEIPPPPGLLAQFLADEEDENAPVQEPVFLAANLSLVDGGIAGTGGNDVLRKTPSAAWDDEYHYAHVAGTGAYAGERDDDTGYVLTINADEGFTFDLDAVTFMHRATSTGPGMVGVKVNGVNYSGTGDEVSTTVTTYESEALGLTSLTQAVIYVQGWDSPGTGNGQFQMNDLQILGSVESDDPSPDPDPVDVINLTFVGDNPTVSFEAEAGLNYYLVYTTDLTGITQVDPPILGEWDIADQITNASAGPEELSDSAPADEMRYYGVLVTVDPL